MTSTLDVRVLLLLIAGATVRSRADTLVFLPQINNYWPDPKNWFTVDPNTQMLLAAGRTPAAGDYATISAHAIADLTTLSVNLNTLTLNSDAVVSNGLITASKVITFAGSNGSGIGFQNDVLTVLTEMGSCGLSATTLTIRRGAFVMLGTLGVAGQLSFSSSTIYDYGQISFASNGSFLSGGSSLVNETNAFIVASTNASLSGGNTCVFDNSGVVRCDAGTFSLGQFGSWTSRAGVAQFDTTSSNAVIDFPTGLTIPPGATNYFYGPGTNERVAGTVQGTAGGGIAGKFSNLAGMRAGNGVVLVPSVAPTAFNLVAANEPALSAFSYNGHQFSFRYPSTSGLTNIIEYTASLNPINWLVLTNVAGDGTLRTIIDATATNSERFYRILFQ